jgi:hypothetical protein
MKSQPARYSEYINVSLVMTDSQPDRAFFRKAVLDTIVPETSNPRLPEILDDTIEETEDDISLLSIKQRGRLFFGK